MEAEHHVNCKVTALLIIILYWEWEGLQVYLTRAWHGLREPNGRRESNQLKRAMNLACCTKTVIVPGALIYALCYKGKYIWQAEFLPPAVPRCATIIVDFTNLKKVGMSQSSDGTVKNHRYQCILEAALALTPCLVYLTKGCATYWERSNRHQKGRHKHFSKSETWCSRKE